jgi:hypothetical protein
MHKYSAWRLPSGDRRRTRHVGIPVLHTTCMHDVCQPLQTTSALAARRIDIVAKRRPTLGNGLREHRYDSLVKTHHLVVALLGVTVLVVWLLNGNGHAFGTTQDSGQLAYSGVLFVTVLASVILRMKSLRLGAM